MIMNQKQAPRRRTTTLILVNTCCGYRKVQISSGKDMTMAVEPYEKPTLITKSLKKASDDDSEQATTAKASFQEFGSEVSIAGVKYVSLPSANFIRRLLWLTLVLFGLGFATYQIRDRIAHYISRPTTVDLKINNNETITFPTVTICNQNQFNKDRVNGTYPGLLSAIELIYPAFRAASDIPDYVTAHSLCPEAFQANVDWEPIYQSWQNDIGEAVQQVEFDGRFYTTPTDVFSSVLTDAGYCMQFNSDGNQNSSYSGRRRGLRLLLFVDQDNYVFSDSVSAGFQVALHPHYETPSVSDLGFFVSPGEQTLVKTTVKTVKELPAPHTDCLNEYGHDQYGCELACTADYFYDRCGCRQYSWPGSQKVCSPINTSCITLEEGDFLESDYVRKKCNCPQPCEHNYYDYGVSTGVVSERVKSYLERTLYISPDDLTKNYVVLDIYLSDLRIEESTVSESYSILALLCDIGGALGLILGSTVLTVFEIGDFFIVSSWQLCSARKAKKKTRPFDDN